MARRLRLDAELVRRGMARSREHASQLIADNRVTIAGMPATKAATGVTTDAAVVVRTNPDDPEYASRGAHKLVGALAEFAPLGFDVVGKRCLDAGASTGGFTDVLLREGAAEVLAVDVGYGLLIWRLQNHPDVTVHDRTNVRHLSLDDINDPVEVVVADLSFISLTLVLPALARVVAPGADLALMVKPQFEVGKDNLGKGGVVWQPADRAAAVIAVAEAAQSHELGAQAIAASPLPGPAGNREFFVWFKHAARSLTDEQIHAAVLANAELPRGDEKVES